ncbi:MAG: RNA polymerase sigma factor RpoD/SigA [Candidatus Cloacimonadota bacterium]|nr:MAG: RNA polymerase sigma factor RpoD/SigA [Candidatus Cloacimonadota bacterium]
MDTKEQWKVADEPLPIYLREIQKYPLLTKEQEIELAKKIKKGSKKSIEKLVESNLRFVVSIATMYKDYGIPLMDLINEGNIGLLTATKKFDEKKGVRFISYAVWWIKQAILKTIAEQTRIVRLPLNQKQKIKSIAKMRDKLKQKGGGREPSEEEIAKALSLKTAEVKKAIAMAKQDISLDAPIKSTDNLYFFDVISSKSYPSPEEIFFRKNFKNEIMRQLKKLPPRECKILVLYFGLDGERPHTLEEIGTTLNLSRERVRQLKEKALHKIRNFPDSALLKSFS